MLPNVALCGKMINCLLLSRQTIQTAFFSELCPFFDLDFFILYQAPHSQTLAHACGALVQFSRSAVTDSEEEDSAESSTDEEEETSTVGEDG